MLKTGDKTRKSKEKGKSVKKEGKIKDDVGSLSDFTLPDWLR